MENVIDIVYRYNLDTVAIILFYAITSVAIFGCGWGAASERAHIKLRIAEQKLNEANAKMDEVTQLKKDLDTLHTQLSDMAHRYYCAGVWSVVAKLRPEVWEDFKNRRLKMWVSPRFLLMITEDDLGTLGNYSAVKDYLPDEAALPDDRRAN